MTTDNTQELDEILYRFVPSTDYSDKREGDPTDCQRAKAAILDWHNKQIEEVLDRLENQVKSLIRKPDGTSIGAEYIPLSAIEAERNKLKERDDE